MPAIPNIIQATLSEAGAAGLGAQTGGRRSGFIATSATSTVAVRSTTYTSQGADAQRSFKSTNVNDTAAGTGARTIRFIYFAADCSGPFTEELMLNGTTAVNTVATNIAFIEKMEVLTVGSGGDNAGTIQVWTQAAGAGAAWGSIAPGLNRTYWAHHYVALGSLCFVTQMDVVGKSVAGIAGLYANDPTDGAPPLANVDTTIGYTNFSVVVPFLTPITVQGPAYIILQVKPDAATASTSYGGFGFFEQAS